MAWEGIASGGSAMSQWWKVAIEETGGMGEWRRVLSGITISRIYAMCSARVIQGSALLARQDLRDCKVKNASYIDLQAALMDGLEIDFRGDHRRELHALC